MSDKELIAAARQPADGDREALVRVVANHPIAPLMRLGGDAGYPLADAILAAGFSRAAVPDAATEELERIKPLFENLSREYPNECNKRVKAEAERDAALAALERVRAVCLHLGGVDGDVSQPAPSYYVSVGRDVVATEVLAALDGAPEPGREAQLERVAARLREIVYLCGDDLGCQCEEAQDALDIS